MRPVILAVAAAFLCIFSGAQAQENMVEKGTTAADDVRKVLMDTSSVRVVEMHFRPGQKVDVDGKPSRLIYMLNDGSLIFSPPGRPSYELTLNRGEVAWVPPASNLVENDGARTVRALMVEIKGGSAAPGKTHARRAKANSRGRSTKKAPRVRTAAK
jgi:hypothetical protein